MTDLVLFGHPDSGLATRPADFLVASPCAEKPLLMFDGFAHIRSRAILLELASQLRCLGAETPGGLRRGQELLMWEANRIGMYLPQLERPAATPVTGSRPAQLTG